MSEKIGRIQIDDAGTGDLVGDAFIGFLKENTGQIIFKTIPVEMFNEENWNKRMPFKVVVDLVKEGLEELNFQNDKEKILICRGNIFDQVRAYFNEQGIQHEPAIIEGTLQDAVEGRYISHLRKDLGIKSKNLTKKSGAKRYFVLFNWICRDFYKREKYVKTGFKRWKTVWREKAIERYNKMKYSNHSQRKISN